MRISREELAWAGGLFEGEGCITTKKSRWLSLAVTSTDKDVVERFCDIIQLGKVLGPYNTSHGPREQAWYKQKYVWQVGGLEKSQAVIAMLWPWLGIRRRARWSELLPAAVRVLPARQTCLRGHSYTPENTYIGADKSRYCRACRRDKATERRRRSKLVSKSLDRATVQYAVI